MSSAPRGLAPREGLGSVLMKMGRAGPLLEPRRRPQAGKSGDPHSQNANRVGPVYKGNRTQKPYKRGLSANNTHIHTSHGP